MSESKSALTRREVIVGGAIALAGAAITGTANAQTEKPDTKQVPVYVTDEELVEWTTEFAGRIKAGVPIIRTFKEVSELTDNKWLKEFSLNSVEFLKMGCTISDIMSIYRHIFDRNYVTTVRYGELYGILDETLEMWLKHRPKREIMG